MKDNDEPPDYSDDEEERMAQAANNDREERMANTVNDDEEERMANTVNFYKISPYSLRNFISSGYSHNLQHHYLQQKK